MSAEPILVEFNAGLAARFANRLRELAESHSDPIKILEGGCGRAWPVDLSDVNYHLTGIDIDEHALETRVREMKDLDTAVLGNLLNPDAFEPESFDAIYSSFVLEHIDGTEAVLDNFVRWVRPGGRVLLQFPDGDSVFGWITRMTPHLVHVWFYRYVVGYKPAGKPGHVPYRTLYGPQVSRSGMRAYCNSRKLTIIDESGTNFVQEFPGLRWKVAGVAVRAIGALSLGRLDWRYNNINFVIEKPLVSS